MYMDNRDVPDPFRPEKTTVPPIRSGQFLNLPIQALAEPLRHLKHPFVADELHNVPCAVEHRRAVSTDFEMRFHSLAQFRRDVVIEIVGDLPPHFDATDLNYGH